MTQTVRSWTVVQFIQMYQHPQSQPENAPRGKPEPAHDLVAEYRECELRALISSRLMGLDQKILHLPPPEPEQMARKREKFLRASEVFEAGSGASFQGLTEQADPIAEYMRMKFSILNALRASGFGPARDCEWLDVAADPATQSKFAYIHNLKRIFSGNLSAAVVYGSSVFSETPGDYDNYLIVKDLELAYRQATNFKLEYKNRPVHLNFIPEDLAGNILSVVTIPVVRHPWLAVIEGQVQLPVMPNRIIYLQGRARALELIESRRKLLLANEEQLAETLLARPVADSKASFASIAFLPAIMTEWTRLFAEDPEARPVIKTQVLQNLRAEGFGVPVFSSDKAELREQLCLALILHQAVLQRAQNLTLERIR